MALSLSGSMCAGADTWLTAHRRSVDDRHCRCRTSVSAQNLSPSSPASAIASRCVGLLEMRSDGDQLLATRWRVSDCLDVSVGSDVIAGRRTELGDGAPVV